MHEKQAEVIRQLFSLLLDANSEVGAYTSVWSTGSATDEERYKKVAAAIHALWDYHRHHQIYLSKSLADQVRVVTDHLFGVLKEFKTAIRLENAGHIGEQDAVDRWEKSETKLKEIVTPLFDSLKAEFRELLGSDKK